MGLFPGEKELFESSMDFEINDSEGNFGEPVIVCRGGCDRRKRPLAQDVIDSIYTRLSAR